MANCGSGNQPPGAARPAHPHSCRRSPQDGDFAAHLRTALLRRLASGATTLLLPLLFCLPGTASAVSLSLDYPTSINMATAKTKNLRGYKITLSEFVGAMGIAHEEYSYEAEFTDCKDVVVTPNFTFVPGDSICTTTANVVVNSLLIAIPGETFNTSIGYGQGTVELSPKSGTVFSASPMAATLSYDKLKLTQTMFAIALRPRDTVGVTFGFHQFIFKGRRTFTFPESPGSPKFSASVSEAGTLIYLGLAINF